MNLHDHWYAVARRLGAVLVIALATMVLNWLSVGSTTAGMVFLVFVVWFAAQSGLVLSLFVAVFCAVAFDYYFLPPVHTLILAGTQEWVAMFSFLACSLVTGRVAELARRQTRKSEQRRADVERLYTLSQEMMLYENAASLVRDLPSLLQRIFGLADVALYVREQDQFYSSMAELPAELRNHLRELTDGHDCISDPVSGFSAQALMLGLRPVGALAWSPDSLSLEVATAASVQVAIALTWAMAIEVSTRLEAARESDRLRTALIDSITHELRTPLTSIRAAATTLIEGGGLDDATRLDLASIVDEEASRLDTLIGEAVEMAEIDAKVVRVHATPQSVRALFDQAVAESREQLASHKVVIDIEGPDTPVWFDPHLLGRVLRHLLENAAYYCPRGSRITLRSRRIDGRLEFAVEDTGPGIDPVDLLRIFERSYRGRKGTVLSKGSGKGLAIVRAILSAHDGAIEASSVLGQGTVFRFWVPLVEGKSKDEQEPR